MSERLPCSTTCPAYMTTTRSATSAMTPRSWVMSRTPTPSSFPQRPYLGQDLGLRRHVEGGGGLVGDEDFGRTRKRHGDHDTLAHPAGELVRVRPGPVFRPGYADPVQEVDGPVHCRSSALVLVRPYLLDDLVADPLHRVERRHRVLEDHGYPAAADALELTFRRRHEVKVAEHGTARKTGIGATGEAHERHSCNRLAGTGLADDPE